MMPIIMNSFDFEFVDKEQAMNKPQNNALMFKRPKILMKLIKK